MPVRSSDSSVDPYAAMADLNDERRVANQIRQAGIELTQQLSQKSKKKSITRKDSAKLSLKSRKSSLSSTSRRKSLKSKKAKRRSDINVDGEISPIVNIQDPAKSDMFSPEPIDDATIDRRETLKSGEQSKTYLKSSIERKKTHTIVSSPGPSSEDFSIPPEPL